MRLAHLVPAAPELPIWLFERNGPIRLFSSRVALARFLGHANLVHHPLVSGFRSIRRTPFSPVGWVEVEHTWIARQGDTCLTSEDLVPLLPEREPSLRQRLSWQPEHLRRRGPVPHTGRIHRYSSYLRAPRTQQLLRDVNFSTHEEAGVPPIRARLGHRPTRWDDRTRSTVDNRNWKHQRRTQWKERP